MKKFLLLLIVPFLSFSQNKIIKDYENGKERHTYNIGNTIHEIYWHNNGMIASYFVFIGSKTYGDGELKEGRCYDEKGHLINDYWDCEMNYQRDYFEDRYDEDFGGGEGEGEEEGEE